MIGGLRHGYPVSPLPDRVFCRERRPGVWLRTFAEAVMSWVQLIGSTLAVLVFVYLVIALLFPEKF
jgi:K+-transporting ATPase KdpF subunit